MPFLSFHWHIIFNMVRQIVYVHRREVHIIRDRERIQYKYMKEEDHFTLTQLPALNVAFTATALSLDLSHFALTHSLSTLSLGIYL